MNHPILRKPIQNFLLVVLCAIATSCTSTPPSLGKGLNTGDDAIWNAVESAGRTEGLLGPGEIRPDPQAEGEWLYGHGAKISDAFWSQCHGPRLEKKLSFYVDQFGKHGAKADFVWMLGCPRLLLQGHYASPEVQARGNEMYAKGFRRLNEIICKEEVGLFATRPDIFDRYYRAVFWSHILFGDQASVDGAFRATMDWAVKEHLPELWPRGRLLLMLFHATGRGDLISSSPDDLQKSYENWNHWMEADEVLHHMKADCVRPVWTYDSCLIFVKVPWPIFFDRPFPDLHEPLHVPFADFYNDQMFSLEQRGSPAYIAIVEAGKPKVE